MDEIFDFPVLNRPVFFDGQRLSATDLKAAQDYCRELHYLHNRCLHSWGIVRGYAVSGRRGERLVQVQPGYALDCLGHDLILSKAQSLTIPAVAGNSAGNPATYYLTVSYAADTELTAETRTGVCGASGAVRYPEQPRLRWQEPGDHQHGRDIVLASIQVQNCRLTADVSTAERRSAILAQQPYLAAGQTNEGETAWQLWPNDDDPIGVTTTVSTHKVGFRARPRYDAHVVGSRRFQIGEQSMAVVDGYTHIAAPTSTSFELRLILPEGQAPGFILNPASIVLTPAFMERLASSWYVVWLGVEG